MNKKVFKIKKIEVYKVSGYRIKTAEVIAMADMLRYDTCYANANTPEFVIFLNGRKPTIDRWKSFGQELLFIERISFISPELWFTYVHNREHGLDKEFLCDRKEYGQPVKVVLVE